VDSAIFMSFFVKSVVSSTVDWAQRNAPSLHINCIFDTSTGRLLPGAVEAKAITQLGLEAVQVAINSDSPVSILVYHKAAGPVNLFAYGTVDNIGILRLVYHMFTQNVLIISYINSLLFCLPGCLFFIKI